MSELRKANTDHSYFLTLTVEGWVDVFTRDIYCQIIYENIEYCRRHKGLEIYAYVIMSNHIHLIARQKDGKLNEWLRDFKSYTAKRILEAIANNDNESRKDWLIYMFKYFANQIKQNKDHAFWQKTNHPVELNTPGLFNQKMEYIHRNPLKAGIVTDENYYLHSSACPFAILKVDEF